MFLHSLRFGRLDLGEITPHELGEITIWEMGDWSLTVLTLNMQCRRGRGEAENKNFIGERDIAN